MNLPEWPPGTVALLATSASDAGRPVHAIPISTALRAADDRVLLALGPRRSTLARLREQPEVALALLGPDDVAVTILGRARVVADPLAGAEPVVGVELAVRQICDHGSARFRVDDGVRWRWTDPEAERRDAATRAALERLA